MTVRAAASFRSGEDPVGNVLKWTLLAVAIVTFAMLGWTTKVTYQTAPPIPAKFVTPNGSTLMTDADIVAGKGGFQRADLMDYGSLYGMGSYFGEDYTAANLVRLGTLTEDFLAEDRAGKPLAQLARRSACRAPWGGRFRACEPRSSLPSSITTTRRDGRRPTVSIR